MIIYLVKFSGQVTNFTFLKFSLGLHHRYNSDRSLVVIRIFKWDMLDLNDAHIYSFFFSENSLYCGF